MINVPYISCSLPSELSPLRCFSFLERVEKERKNLQSLEAGW